MLIYGDSNQLGDKKLSKEEALLEKYEDTDRQLKRYRLDDHEELKDEKKRSGYQKHSSELISKVCTLNPKLWVEETVTPRYGTVLNFYTTGRDEQGKEIKRCLQAAFYPGWMPEFSWLEVDRADLPIKEHRGWRTVLMRLLKAQVLNWRDVKETFGDATGEQSTRWRKETQEFRT